MPLNIVYTSDFLKTAKKLPANVHDKLVKQIGTLEQNPFHSVLHAKPLAGQLAGFYSFRITRDWRVIFYFLNELSVKLIRVGHRKDIYK